ncbi:MAG: NUDIX domain-containing protein [Cyclonatronaceae bacterium]
MNSAVQLIDVYPYRYSGSELQFLLLKRSKGRIYEGQWRMVGGKVQAGEKRSQAAFRELVEEVDVTPVVFWAVPAVNHFYDLQTDSFMMVAAFAAELPAFCAVKLNHEHEDYCWVNETDAGKMLIWPEQIKMTGYISDILKKKPLPETWIISNHDQQN